MPCTRCGFENPSHFKFCGQCGTGLEQTADRSASPVGERRHLSVMYCDLAGSTELSAHLDPEELREVLRAYRAACAGVIERLEGYVAQYLGDGLLVHFGSPQAHEDDTHRAVCAGLRIVQAVKGLSMQLSHAVSAPLSVRVGIHTGLVVVDEIGAGPKLAHVPLGEAPNIAARLQALAEPNTVVISGATARLLRGAFECHDLGAHLIKGIPSPIQVFRVLKERSHRSQSEGPAVKGAIPLVGRVQEVDVMRRCWARARDGKGQGVVLIGEPGIGKTRLVRMMKELVANDGGLWLEGRCSPYYQNSAFYPVIELVEQALGFGYEDAAEERLRKLETGLRRFPVPLPEIMPLFTSLLSLPPERYPPPALAPAAQKQRIVNALLDLLQAMTEKSPVLVVAENLQWADPSTLELLALLIDRVPTSPLLVLLTCRPEFQPPWGTLPHLTRIALDRFSRKETEMLVERVAGKPLPVEVLEQVAAKTDGVPLFAEELTRMVLETDLMLERGDRYELAGLLPALAIPATLQESLMARLDRLPGTRGVAQVAAVLGRTFSHELLRTVSPLEEAALEQKLDMLVTSGLLFQSGLPPRATYTFKHALIQDAAYQSLLKSARKRYHGQAARALMELFPETADTQPELLAHHFTASGAVAEAVTYWKRAGERAQQRSANVEAIAHLTRGLDLLRTLPDGPQRAQHELDLQVNLIGPLIATRGYGAPAVETICLRARELCRRAGQAPKLFPVLWGSWQCYLVRAEFRMSREIGEQLLRLAGSDVVLLMLAHGALGVTLFFMGELPQALAHLQRTMALYDPAKHRSLAFSYTQDPNVAARAYAAIVLWCLGYSDQALQKVCEALDHARDLRHPFSHVFALNHWNWLFQLRREPQPIREQADVTLRLSSEQQFALGQAKATILRGWTVAQEHRGTEGLAELQRGLASWRATGARLLEPYYLALLAEAACGAGLVTDGLAAVAEALAVVRTTGECWYEAELYRLRGELLLQRAARGGQEAEAAFLHALDSARRLGARALELRAAVSLSRLLRAQGRGKNAQRVLLEAYGRFTEGFDTVDLQEGRRLIEASWSATTPVADSGRCSMV